MEVHEEALGGYPCLVVGAGPPLVVLSGLAPEAGFATGWLRRSHEATAKVWARGRRVFYLNLRPGMTRGMTVSEIAAEQAAALRAGFEGPVDLLGISTGGSIAQQLAAEHPDAVRRLVLISTGCRLSPSARDVQRRVAARVRAGGHRQAVAVFVGDLVPPGPLTLFAAAGGWLLGGRLASDGLRDMATMIEAEDEFDLRRLPEISAPALLVRGERDRFYGAELVAETAALIPGSELATFPRVGHMLVVSHPRAVARVLGFLA